jgi:acyl-CoA hydrolase
MAVNEPVKGNLRWGLLLEVLDKMAEDVALAYVHRSNPEAKVVTAAIDDIVLHTPVDINQNLNLRARINYVGRSSMEVGIRIDQPGSEMDSLASSYFTMVARPGEGSTGKDLSLEQLEYVDELEKFRYAAAVQRREDYRNRLDGFSFPPGEEEFQLLKSLHTAQEQPDFNGFLAGDLVRSNLERMYPENENVPQKIFGGYLMRRAFEFALMHAEEIATHRPVMVRINRINFLQPVRIGDKLHFNSRIVYTGHSSICVEVTIERTSLDRVTKAISNTCVFTFVNVDSPMQPQPVPKVYPTTYAEDARYLEAYRRQKQLVKSC